MKLTLSRRRHGIHQPVRTCEVPGRTSDYVRSRPDAILGRTYTVVEDKLLAALPAGFLPHASTRILLTVSDGPDEGSTAVVTPRRFRPWGKYFDAYILLLERDQRPSWRTMHERWRS